MACPATGNKSEAKALMSEAGVPVVPGYHGQDQSMSRSALCTHRDWTHTEQSRMWECAHSHRLPAVQHMHDRLTTSIRMQMLSNGLLEDNAWMPIDEQLSIAWPPWAGAAGRPTGAAALQMKCYTQVREARELPRLISVRWGRRLAEEGRGIGFPLLVKAVLTTRA